MDDDTCSVRIPDGALCGRASFDESLPFPLCTNHFFAVRRWDYRDAAPELWEKCPQPAPLPDTSIVYYVRVGALVKIGTTVHTVRQRFGGQLPPDAQVLAIEPGARDLERSRHRQFWRLREGGEWFRGAPELWEHVQALREQHGVPEDLTYV